MRRHIKAVDPIQRQLDRPTLVPPGPDVETDVADPYPHLPGHKLSRGGLAAAEGGEKHIYRLRRLVAATHRLGGVGDELKAVAGVHYAFAPGARAAQLIHLPLRLIILGD
eukprot:scaffold112698_cov24-Prasinocladus_malaysianus.AAC.2